MRLHALAAFLRAVVTVEEGRRIDQIGNLTKICAVSDEN